MADQEITVPILRHFPTKLNEQSVSRGWLPSPPDPKEIEKLGPGAVKALKDLNVSSMESSTLPRAAKSMEYAAKELGVDGKAKPAWKTWNSGSEVQGKPEEETIPIRQKYIRFPDTKPRGGEEFDEFMDRGTPELKRVLAENAQKPDTPKGLVLHGHHMMSLESMVTGKPVDPKKLETLDKDFPPGSVSVLHVNGKEARLERVHPPAGEQVSGATGESNETAADSRGTAAGERG